MKKITIQDIAKELGLSRNTVAKALNNGMVSPETKIAVVQKAQQMGYAKLDENIAREVRDIAKKSNTGTVLVLFNRSESTFWSRTITGISDEVNDEGYRMQLHIVDETDTDGEDTLRKIAEDVRGIIFLCMFPIAFVKGVAKAGLPMTFFNTPINAQEYIQLGDIVNLESFYAMNRIVSHVIEDKNCRNLAFIGYAEGSRVVQARYLGFLNACNQHLITLQENMLFTKPSDQTYFSYSMVEEVIGKMPVVPEAIVCENDDIAKYVATALMRKNPQLAMDMVITGFDGTVEKDFFKTDIITVEVRKEELGRRLVKTVLDRVKNPDLDKSFITISTYPRI